MLGPQVCVKCRAEYDYEKISEDVVRWHCPKCGETESHDYALTISKELYEEIYGRKFPDLSRGSWYTCAKCDAGYSDQKCVCKPTRTFDDEEGRVKSPACPKM